MESLKSCGAIVFRCLESKKVYSEKLEVLLVRYGQHHWGFPKGHVEDSESDEETALREIKEETGLDVVLDTSFRKVTNYKNKRGMLKWNVFFVGEPKSPNSPPVPQLSEVSDVKWFNAFAVESLVTFPGDYELYLEALEHYCSFPK